MVLINYAGREINAKIVYYGPGLSGKTTNLECIYASVPQQSRGKMVSMKTRQDRTLFFDFLPLELGEVHGFRTRFLLYTVPGQVFYNATRKLVLKGADAVVFVADSGLGKMDENLESLRNLEENLREQGMTLEGMPWVIQYNKRDLPQVYGVPDLEAALNPCGVPSFEAAAASGRGVYETLHAVSRSLFQRLMAELRPGPGRPAAAIPAAPSPGVVPAGPARPAAPARAAAPPSPPLAAPLPRPAFAEPAGATARQAREPHDHETLHPPQVAFDPVRARQPAHEPQRSPQVAAQQPWSAVPAPDPGFRRAVAAAAGPSGMPLTEPEGEAAAPQLFGAPTSHVPAAPTPAQILDSVQASAQALGGAAPATGEAAREHGGYGRVVDLELQAGEPGPSPPPSGFIKDPMRRADPGAAAPGMGAPATRPVRTQHVSVVISRAELKQGGTIRLVLDVKVEA